MSHSPDAPPLPGTATPDYATASNTATALVRSSAGICSSERRRFLSALLEALRSRRSGAGSVTTAVAVLRDLRPTRSGDTGALRRFPAGFRGNGQPAATAVGSACPRHVSREEGSSQ